MAVPTIYAKMLDHFDKTDMKASNVAEACKNVRCCTDGFNHTEFRTQHRILRNCQDVVFFTLVNENKI
jgi:hypothetical protein